MEKIKLNRERFVNQTEDLLYHLRSEGVLGKPTPQLNFSLELEGSIL